MLVAGVVALHPGGGGDACADEEGRPGPRRGPRDSSDMDVVLRQLLLKHAETPADEVPLQPPARHHQVDAGGGGACQEASFAASVLGGELVERPRGLEDFDGVGDLGDDLLGEHCGGAVVEIFCTHGVVGGCQVARTLLGVHIPITAAVLVSVGVLGRVAAEVLHARHSLLGLQQHRDALLGISALLRFLLLLQLKLLQQKKEIHQHHAQARMILS